MAKTPITDPTDRGFEYIKFTIDAQLLRELGERLVGKPHIALGELVKNAYDADATRCVISIREDEISVTDNGNGMHYVDFIRKWMRIGSPHKRNEKESPQLHRPLTGSKGIGRLSAQFLGASLEVISIPKKRSSNSVRARVNWEEAYSKGSLIEAGAMVKEGDPSATLPNEFQHGTSIVIRRLKDVWTPELLKELATEFWFLRPPKPIADDIPDRERFEIELTGVDKSSVAVFESQSNAALENWLAKIEGTIVDGRDSGKAKLKLTFSDGAVYKANYTLPNKALDTAQFELFIYKLTGKQTAGISVGEARSYMQRFGGVHIYDSGFRLPHYGGGDQDWLQIEMAHSHRLLQSKLVPENLRPESASLQDLPTLSRVLGIVRVSTAHEDGTAPKKTPPSKVLSVQVTRDRLTDNLAFGDLIYFVRWAFDFYSYQSTSRRAHAATQVLAGRRVDHEVLLQTVREKTLELKENVPAKLVAPLESALDRFEEAELLRRQQADAERVLLGALATAGMGSVALQHELSKELAVLGDLVKKLESHLSKDTGQVMESILVALRAWLAAASQTRRLFSPFFDAEDRETLKRMRVKRVLERLSSNLAPLLRGIEIEIDEIPDQLKLPRGTLAGWNAVFQNLFINSVNATLDVKNKRIRCRAAIDAKARARLIVEDTGVGTDLEKSEELFQPFVRRLELPADRKALGLGGMGIGLTIVRMVCQTFGCDVRFIGARSPFTTAIEITWQDSANG